MGEKLTVLDVYNNAESCGDHPLGIDAALLDGALTLVALGSCSCYEYEPNATYETCNSYCDSSSFALGKLADGRFIVIEESSDTSGHGCQCSGSATIHDTLDAAVANFTREERAIVQANLPDTSTDQPTQKVRDGLGRGLKTEEVDQVTQKVRE
jgi:hypothetical protein